jgi:hypothetical protein
MGVAKPIRTAAATPSDSHLAGKRCQPKSPKGTPLGSGLGTQRLKGNSNPQQLVGMANECSQRQPRLGRHSCAAKLRQSTARSSDTADTTG